MASGRQRQSDRIIDIHRNACHSNALRLQFAFQLHFLGLSYRIFMGHVYGFICNSHELPRIWQMRNNRTGQKPNEQADNNIHFPYTVFVLGGLIPP